MAAPDDAERPLAPRRNPDLVGHGEAAAALARLARSGRLPHAILIGGPRGIGKATLAFRFARWLLAQADGGDTTPSADLALDPGHPVARRVAGGGHADLLTVERQWDPKRKRLRGEILAEEARAVAEFFHKTAAEGGWRIAIIDGAEEMNRHAANGILKILEEPPARSLLILVSHAAGRLLPTIRSRCRRLMLQPLAEAEVAALLALHRPDLPQPERTALARLAEGSIGRALELAESGGLALQQRLEALLAGLPRLDFAAVHELADTVARGDEDGFRTLTELLLELMRRAAVAAACGEAGTNPLQAHAAGERFIRLGDGLRELFARGEALALDRRQMLLDAFIRLERGARQAAG